MATSIQTQINRIKKALLILAEEIEAINPQSKNLVGSIELTLQPKRKPKGIKG